MPAFTPLALLLGLAVGSFLNVVILREESGEKLTGRSHCTMCGKTLVWYELMPVFSYLMQRGRCRACHAPLSIQYPLVELATAMLFVAVWYHLGEGIAPTSYKLQATSFLLQSALWSTLIVIFVYDLKTKLIPDRFSILFAMLALATTLLSQCSVSSGPVSCQLPAVSYYALAGLLLFLPFYALWKYSDGRWIGLGDGKLAVGIGWLLGPVGGGSAIMFGFWVGAVVMLILIGVQRLLAYAPIKLQATSYKLGLKSEIPFGPFLIIGIAIVYWTGTTFTSLFM